MFNQTLPTAVHSWWYYIVITMKNVVKFFIVSTFLCISSCFLVVINVYNIWSFEILELGLPRLCTTRDMSLFPHFKANNRPNVFVPYSWILGSSFFFKICFNQDHFLFQPHFLFFSTLSSVITIAICWRLRWRARPGMIWLALVGWSTVITYLTMYLCPCREMLLIHSSILHLYLLGMREHVKHQCIMQCFVV